MNFLKPSWLLLFVFAVGGMFVVAAKTSAQEEERDRPREKAEPREARDEPRGNPQIAELEQRLEQLERQIRELKEAGKEDAVEERTREFRQLQEKLTALRRGGQSGGERDRPQREIPEEVRGRIETYKFQIQQLREAGKVEEAERLELQLKAYLARLEGERTEVPAEVREKAQRLRDEIGKLREAGENEKAAELEREYRSLVARFSPRPDDPRRQRLQHLRMAAEHLRAAGLADLAEKVAAEAERLQGEVAEGDRPRREGEERGEPRERDQDRPREREREGERDRPRERERESDRPREGDREKSDSVREKSDE